MVNIEAEVQDIKQSMVEISEKLDELLNERQIVSMMKLAEVSLSEFLENEPNIYGIEDLKVMYK